MNNFARVTVYIRSLKVDKVEQIASYTIVDLISDIGMPLFSLISNSSLSACILKDAWNFFIHFHEPRIFFCEQYLCNIILNNDLSNIGGISNFGLTCVISHFRWAIGIVGWNLSHHSLRNIWVFISCCSKRLCQNIWHA